MILLLRRPSLAAGHVGTAKSPPQRSHQHEWRVYNALKQAEECIAKVKSTVRGRRLQTAIERESRSGEPSHEGCFTPQGLLRYTLKQAESAIAGGRFRVYRKSPESSLVTSAFARSFGGLLGIGRFGRFRIPLGIGRFGRFLPFLGISGSGWFRLTPSSSPRRTYRGAGSVAMVSLSPTLPLALSPSHFPGIHSHCPLSVR